MGRPRFRSGALASPFPPHGKNALHTSPCESVSHIGASTHFRRPQISSRARLSYRSPKREARRAPCLQHAARFLARAAPVRLRLHPSSARLGATTPAGGPCPAGKGGGMRARPRARPHRIRCEPQAGGRRPFFPKSAPLSGPLPSRFPEIAIRVASGCRFRFAPPEAVGAPRAPSQRLGRPFSPCSLLRPERETKSYINRPEAVGAPWAPFQRPLRAPLNRLPGRLRVARCKPPPPPSARLSARSPFLGGRRRGGSDWHHVISPS